MDEPAPSVRLNVYLDPAVDRQLRLACLELHPRPSLSDAVEQAVRLWLEVRLGITDADIDNDGDDAPVAAR